jgi:hypothetical protein
MLNAEQVDTLYGIREIVFYKNGLVVKRSARFPMARTKPVARKGVFDMSRKSKLRLTHIVANCELKFSSMFTLTYGDFFIPHDGKELKRQVNLMLTSFRKRFDNEYIWFLEFTTKKTRPHLHIITTVVPNEWDRRWLGERWAAITIRGYVKRINEGKYYDVNFNNSLDQFVQAEETKKVVNVHSHKKCWELIRKADGAQRYCLKYAAKEEQKLIPLGFQNVGRFWGTSQGVTPKEIARLIIGETMTEEKVRELMLDTFVGQFPLIPKYVFQQNALEFFTSRGFLLTEIIDKKAFDDALSNGSDVV